MSRWSAGTKVAVIWAVIASVVGIGLALKILFDEPNRGEDVCISALENGHTIVLIDKTDPWNEEQSDRLRDHVKWLVNERMVAEERLSIFAFGEKYNPGFKHKFSKCKPNKGEGRYKAITSYEYLEKRFKKQFVDKLDEVIDSLKHPENGDCSPIAEVLIDILSRREVIDHSGVNRIVLFSDMAQNSAIYSAFTRTRCPDVRQQNQQNAAILVRFFQRHRQIFADKEASFVIFQVLPMDGRPADMPERVRNTWGDVFRSLGIPVEWRLL